jgi:hypothetical protein
MQKYLILIFAVSFLTTISAQDELDSSDNRESEHLTDLKWVADTTFGVFKSMSFSNMRVVYPSYRTFKKFIDTSAAGKQSEVTQYTMYNVYWNSLRVKYTKVINKMWKSGVEWKQAKLDSFYIDSGGMDGSTFVYLNWVIRYKKKQHLVRAVFIKMNKKWFMMDELKYEGIVVEKKKKKKNEKKKNAADLRKKLKGAGEYIKKKE